MTPHLIDPAWAMYLVAGLGTAVLAVPGIVVGYFARTPRLTMAAIALMVPFTLFMLHFTFVVGGPVGLR